MSCCGECGRRKSTPKSKAFSKHLAILKERGLLHDVEHFKYPLKEGEAEDFFGEVPAGQWEHVGVVVLADGRVYAGVFRELLKDRKYLRVQSRARGVVLAVEEYDVYHRAYNRRVAHDAAVGRAAKAAIKSVLFGDKHAHRYKLTTLGLPLIEKRELREHVLDLLIACDILPANYRADALLAKANKRVDIHQEVPHV